MNPYMGSCGCAFANVPVFRMGGGWFFMAKDCSHMYAFLESEARKKKEAPEF